MNKEGIEIMSDINLHVGVLEMELQNCNEMLGESMKDTENWKNQWLELKENYDAVKNNDNNDNYVKLLEKENKELKQFNERVKFENAMYVKDILKLKKRIIGDGLEYLLDSPDLVLSKKAVDEMEDDVISDED
jgi:hypothetical protein